MNSANDEAMKYAIKAKKLDPTDSEWLELIDKVKGQCCILVGKIILIFNLKPLFLSSV